MTGSNRAAEVPHHTGMLRSAVVAVISCALMAICSCGKGRTPGDQGIGSIKVNSTPSVAVIWLDTTGTEKTTPYLLTDVTTGEHTVRLTKAGYADWSSKVTVTAARTTVVDAALSQSFGSIHVNSAPWGAAISLDGTNTGKATPYLFSNVAVGEHHLKLSESGYPTWESTVTVGDGQTSVVKASMKPPPDTQWVTYANVGDRYWITWLGPERAVRFDPADFGFGYPLYIKRVSAVFYYQRITSTPTRRRSSPRTNEEPEEQRILHDEEAPAKTQSDSGKGAIARNEDARYLRPESSFRFKIYGGDGQTLLYQSLTMAATPGEPGPAVVHDLSAPVRLDTGGFYLAVAPVGRSGHPSSAAASRGIVGHEFDALPAPDTGLFKHSYTGSSGHWAAWASGEFIFGVLLSGTSRDTTTVINPLHP